MFMIGHPGVGKSRIIYEARELLKELPDIHIAPLSVTFAALVDALAEAKVYVINPPEEPDEFNSVLICAHELGAFIHKYDNEMTKGLSAFYDCFPYDQSRRHQETKPSIQRPQVNIIAGTTPQDLISLMPEVAWGQGFTSRIILVFSDDRVNGGDDFLIRPMQTEDLVHDLRLIGNLNGEFHVTESYANRVKEWRSTGEAPVPNHPRLIHYVTRRRVHLYKLSMISSVDRGSLAITVEDFDRAIRWLLEAEMFMPDIFKAGAVNADGQSMDEILYFIRAADKGNGVSEHKITHFAKDRIPLHSILRVIDVMEKSGTIYCRGVERKTGVRFFSAANHQDM